MNPPCVSDLITVRELAAVDFWPESAEFDVKIVSFYSSLKRGKPVEISGLTCREINQ